MTTVEVIRDVIREDGKQERKDRRGDLLDKNRSALGEVVENLRTITHPKEVSELAERLKHKGNVTLRELHMLKNAFIHSEENISAFLRVNGALHALIRELSGSDTRFQLAAANCCCNLALGNPKFCFQLTKSAAPYLISSLDGLNNAFLDTCVWTLGNLAGSNLKCWRILKSQGILPKLAHLLTSFSDDIQRSAIYALSQFVKTGFDALETKELELVANEVCPLVVKEPSVYWLLYLLSCSPDCCAVFMRNLLFEQIFKLLSCEDNLNPEVDPVKTTALVRTLANLCASQSGSELFFHIYETEPETVQSTLSLLLTSSYPHIQKEVLWMLGNIMQCYPDSQHTCALLSEIHHDLNAALLKTTAQQT
ncbi:uncharacterized protein [Anabrus simplex]|uniref:uncharacterized protein n=1 Tax=Anabrus simplex TaxID=316456 RepID=UPI0035A3CE29